MLFISLVVLYFLSNRLKYNYSFSSTHNNCIELHRFVTIIYMNDLSHEAPSQELTATFELGDKQIPLPEFLHPYDGGIFIRYVPGTDVTPEWNGLLDDLRAAGYATTKGNEHPPFLYVYKGDEYRDDEITCEGMDGVDLTSDWEDWLGTLEKIED